MTTSTTAIATPRVPPVLAGAFVLVWSTGYIAGPIGVASVAPFTVLAWRFALAALAAGALAWWRHGLPSSWAGVGRIAVVGLMLNALQFGLMYVAFEAGLQPVLAALFHSLSPVVTVLLAGAFLGERVSRVQVVGFVVGVAGVLLVLGPDVEEAGGPLGLVLGALGALFLSLGWLGQRDLRSDLPPLWSATVQFAVSVPPTLAVGLAFEGVWPVTDGHDALWSLLFLAIVNSVVGLLLIQALVRRGGAGASSSVFFLMPPVTAVMALVWFGDTLSARELVGLVIAAVGVAVATRVRASGSEVAPRESST